MDERIYHILVKAAVILTALWIGWMIVQSMTTENSPFSQELSAASRNLEDGQFEDALEIYREILSNDANHTQALYGAGLALAQMDANSPRGEANNFAVEALHAFNRAISLEQHKPEANRNTSLLGVMFANRGIVRDRYGDHKKALQDYTKALELEPKLADGPGWLTRFLRNQTEAPSTIAKRAAYLTEQLNLPEKRQQLSKPELDNEQRSYKM